MSVFQILQNKHGNSNALLEEWLRSENGSHDPSSGKGDLLRWKDVDGVKVPSIRRDLIEAVLAGKVVVKDDQDLRDFIISRL